MEDLTTATATTPAHDDEEAPHQGSWLPFLVLVCLLIGRWMYAGEGNVPVRVRRWYNLQVRVFSTNCLHAEDSRRREMVSFVRSNF